MIPSIHHRMPGGKPFRILVLEHHTHLARSLRLYLEFLGHDVKLVSALSEAARSLQAEPFDMLLSDVYLPEGNCLMLLQHAHDWLPRLVVTMSAFDLEGDALRDCGAVRHHLIKPFVPEDLEELMEVSLNKRALERLRGGSFAEITA